MRHSLLLIMMHIKNQSIFWILDHLETRTAVLRTVNTYTYTYALALFDTAQDVAQEHCNQTEMACWH